MAKPTQGGNLKVGGTQVLEGWKKQDLMQALQTASTSQQRNRAVKLLKKFEPKPKKHLDHEANPKNLRIKKYNSLQAFVCFRCDRVKQTVVKGTWMTSEGTKPICNACHGNLMAQIELTGAKNFNQQNPAAR